jgi:hypothetical protein
MNHIETVTGTIEVLGQSQFDSGGTIYSYIRILDDFNKVIMLKNVIVLNTVNSYISPGEKGSIYLVKLGSKGFIAFAYKNSMRKIYDVEEIKTIAKQFKVKAFLWFCALPFALLSIIFFGIGFVVTPICLYMIYVYFSKLPNMINDATLTAYLLENGFNC